MISEIKQDIAELKTSVAVMSNTLDKQSEAINELTKAFSQLAVFMQKTEENNRRITDVEHDIKKVYHEGTKNCPLNMNRLSRLEKRLEYLDKVLVGVAITVLMQFIGILVFLIEKHIV